MIKLFSKKLTLILIRTNPKESNLLLIINFSPSSKEPKGVINKNNLKNSNSFIQSISNKPYLKKPVLKDSYIFDNIESFKEHEVKPKNLNSKEIDELLSKINKIFMSSELKDLVVNNLSVKEGKCNLFFRKVSL